MKLEKAIEILYLSKEPEFEGDSNDFYEALKLGIEALKLIDEQPPHGYTCIPRPLPGETEE